MAGSSGSRDVSKARAGLISVVIAMCNVEAYLEQCLESVLAQTYADLEVICVNDGSTDRTLEIARRFAESDGRIRLIDKPNGGYGAAMNDGLDIASGEYLGIVEPDDWIEPDMYENLLGLMRLAPEVDVAKAAWYENDGSSQRVNDPYGEVPDAEPFDVRAFPEILSNHPSTMMGLYRMSMVRRFGIRYVEAPGAGWVDNRFFIQTMYHARKVAVTQRAFYHYRVGDFEHSSVLRDCAVPMLRVNDMLDFLDDVDEHSVFRERVEFRAHHYARLCMRSPLYFEQMGEVGPLMRATLARAGEWKQRAATAPAYVREISEALERNGGERRPAAIDPKVSVVVAMLDDEAAVRSYLGNVLAQPFGEVEVVCVDCGSSDFSLAVANLHAMCDGRVQTCSLGDSADLAQAISCGLGLARGDFAEVADVRQPDEEPLFARMLARTEALDAAACADALCRSRASRAKGDAAVQEAARLRAELKKARKSELKVKRSLSYRIGRAITAIPRKFKSSL